MEEIKHFSHDHQLSLYEADDEYEDPKPYLCKICGLPILSSPSYTCSTGCEFRLHKPCALKLPPKFNHSRHDPKHTLRLREGRGNFMYECEKCNYKIHPLVAAPDFDVQIEIEHQSHQEHPLVAFCKEVSCECDACGVKQDGFFFWCEECNFWIHPDCTLFASIVKLASYPHPFILSYSFHTLLLDKHCLICRQRPLLCGHGLYICPQKLGTFAHVRCGREKLASATRVDDLIQLPDAEWDTFPSLVIRTYPAVYVAGAEDDDDKKLTIQKYHDHPLMIHEDDGLMSSSSEPISYLVCDVCIKPINNNNKSSSIFCRCTLEGCRFFVHKICADLLPILKFVIPFGDDEGDDEYDDTLTARLCPNLSLCFFNSVFYCLFCHRPCNGLSYYFPNSAEKFRTLLIDLECMAAPSTIKHASHPQHILFRTVRLTALTPLACCPNDSFVYDVYKCVLCEFYIHISCATLPKRVRHAEYDDHPLDLVFDVGEGTINCNGLFCEVCEKDIDVKYWLYRCDECDQSFHVNCIPSVGYLSKVKFGGTLSLLDCHSDHPLTLTRMLTVATQRCGCCNKIIQGLVDEMAFSCDHCHFWLHFSCARDSAAAPHQTLMIYSEVDDQGLCNEFKEAVRVRDD